MGTRPPAARSGSSPYVSTYLDGRVRWTPHRTYPHDRRVVLASDVRTDQVSGSHPMIMHASSSARCRPKPAMVAGFVQRWVVLDCLACARTLPGQAIQRSLELGDSFAWAEGCSHSRTDGMPSLWKTKTPGEREPTGRHCAGLSIRCRRLRIRPWPELVARLDDGGVVALVQVAGRAALNFSGSRAPLGLPSDSSITAVSFSLMVSRVGPSSRRRPPLALGG